MRSKENPLDLNNFPEDYSKDGKQVLEDTSSYSGYRKKKSGGRDEKDETGKVYECRFCSLKFCKSQALGGHMNRHRQERETETLNKARHLVFTNDNILGQAAAHHHLGGQQYPQGRYQQNSNIDGEPTIPFRSMYTPRLYSASPAPLLPTPPPQPPYMYSSPPRLIPFTSQYAVNDYIVGHVIPGSTTPTPIPVAGQPEISGNNYTCIGAPIGQTFPHSNGSSSSEVGGGGVREMSLYNHEQGLSWGRTCMNGTQQRLDSSSINRFQDGF